MGDGEFDLFAEVFGRYKMHDTSEGKEEMDRFEMEEAHKMVLEEVPDDEWIERAEIVDEVELDETSVKKRLDQLINRGYINERKNPDDARKKQYRRR